MLFVKKHLVSLNWPISFEFNKLDSNVDGAACSRVQTNVDVAVLKSLAFLVFGVDKECALVLVGSLTQTLLRLFVFLAYKNLQILGM